MPRKPPKEVPILLPQNRKCAIAQIERAFAACPRPLTEELVTDWGIDSPAVVENWSRLDRDAVLRLKLFDSCLGEDLSYMSSAGLRYFLPAVCILFLRSPEKIDFSGFANVVSRLEGIAGLRRPISIPGLPDHDDGPYYRPIILTEDQRASLREFCGQIMTIIKKFHLNSYEAEYMQRLTELRKGLFTLTCNQDYDSEISSGCSSA